MGAKTHMWMPKGVRSVFGCVLGRSDLSQWFSVRVEVFKAELRVVNSGPSVVRSMEHGSYKGHSDLHRAGPKPPRTLRFECSVQGSRVGHVHCSHGSSGACITEKLDYVVCPDVLSVP